MEFSGICRVGVTMTGFRVGDRFQSEWSSGSVCTLIQIRTDGKKPYTIQWENGRRIHCDAGNGTGLDHPESSLWFQALRCIADGRPDFAIIENPAGVISRGLRAVLGGLRMVKYCWDDPQIISAEEFGAIALIQSMQKSGVPLEEIIGFIRRSKNKA